MKDAKLITDGRAVFSENQLLYFKKKIDAPLNARLSLCVYADARYKLYVNGRFMHAGPLKGCEKERYYDTVDLFSPALIPGENQIEITLLGLAAADRAGTHRYLTSVYRSGNAALRVWGFFNAGARQEPVFTDESWMSAIEPRITFFAPEYAYYTGLPEHAVFKGTELDWKPAKVIETRPDIFYGELSPWYCVPRTIPLLTRRLANIAPSPNQVYDYGKLTTAYVEASFSGAGRVKITYAESPAGEDGKLSGDYDLIDIQGACDFKPFWFRTFRYLIIETKGAVCIQDVQIIETEYPLKIEPDYEFGNETDNRLWEMSVNTLRRCMHETYEDCPYYEQLQYAMDTYLQIRYTLQLSDDGRLARKAIRDFSLSVNADGLTAARAPSMQCQYIPVFSLFYVLMVIAYFERFADRALLFDCLPVIESIFRWYEKQINTYGMVQKSMYWHFIDWASGWEETHGAPAGGGESIGIESLMYAYTLRRMAAVLKSLSNTEAGCRCSQQAERILRGVRRFCFVPDKMLYADSEKQDTFSQHMQVWAVLSGCAQGQSARDILHKSFSLQAQASFAFSFFLLRALEAADLYEKRNEVLNKFRALTKGNADTLPETPENPRSLCHAWSAVVLYEFTAMDLGVRAESGKVIRIQPYTGERSEACGSVYTKWGRVRVFWRRENEGYFIRCAAPETVRLHICFPDCEEQFLIQNTFCGVIPYKTICNQSD